MWSGGVWSCYDVVVVFVVVVRVCGGVVVCAGVVGCMCGLVALCGDMCDRGVWVVVWHGDGWFRVVVCDMTWCCVMVEWWWRWR